jgi:hypothetical protein
MTHGQYHQQLFAAKSQTMCELDGLQNVELTLFRHAYTFVLTNLEANRRDRNHERITPKN